MVGEDAGGCSDVEVVVVEVEVEKAGSCWVFIWHARDVDCGWAHWRLVAEEDRRAEAGWVGGMSKDDSKSSHIRVSRIR